MREFFPALNAAMPEKSARIKQLRVQALCDRLTGFDQPDEEEERDWDGERRKALPGHEAPDRERE